VRLSEKLYKNGKKILKEFQYKVLNFFLTKHGSSFKTPVKVESAWSANIFSRWALAIQTLMHMISSHFSVIPLNWMDLNMFWKVVYM